jgi:hypothetical protein
VRQGSLQESSLPKSGQPFTVVVARTGSDAKEGYRELTRESTRETFDLRERNVLAISDADLKSADRQRVREAMHRLRERH